MRQTHQTGGGCRRWSLRFMAVASQQYQIYTNDLPLLPMRNKAGRFAFLQSCREGIIGK